MTDPNHDDDERDDPEPEHDSVTPAVEDEPDPDELPRGQYGPTADYGEG